MKYPYIVMGCNTVVAFASSAFQTYIHSTSAKLSRAKFVAKENNVEIQIPKKLNSLINTVMDEMKLEKEFRESIKPYLCTGFNPIHYGNVKLFGDTHVGFPQNFTVDEKINVNLTAMIDDVNVSPDSPECQKLKSSLVLSDKAKKFAIAESFYEVTNQALFTKISLPVFCAVLVNTLIYVVSLREYGKFMNQFYIHLTVVTVFLYFFLNDFTNVYSKLQSDFSAAELGKSYVEGGLEYYEKILERNKTIKKLNKNAPFTEEGESNKFSFEAKLKYGNRHDFLSKFEDSKNLSLYKSVVTALFTIY